MDGPRALIFDMDGVLIDSEPLWHEAEIAAMAEAGVALRADPRFELADARVADLSEISPGLLDRLRSG